MSYQTSLTRMTVKGINAKSTGATLIGTTDSGTTRFYPLMVIFEITAGTLITIVPAVSIGTNGASYNNILAAVTLAGLTAANQMLRSDLAGAIGSVVPNTGIYANVTVGATATTATLDVHVIGYYN